MPATLWSIKFSPWSVRVRWALKVNVPVLVVENKAVMGGKEILEHVQAQPESTGPQLLGRGVDKWLQVADDVMEIERARGLDIALSDNEALKGMVPPAMRWLFKLGPIGLFLIKGQVRALARKYPRPYDEEELKAALAKILAGIYASSNGYLVGDSLTFADIACATAVETVRGTPGKHVIQFFPPHQGLNCPLDDLLAWRDRMHQLHWVEGI